MDLNNINALNKKAMELNNKRQQQIGALDAAKANYDAKVKEYERLYNVIVDDTNIQEEYSKVSTKVAEESEKLRQHILDIENGTYKAKIVVQPQTTQAPVQEVVQEVVQPVVQEVVHNPVVLQQPVVQAPFQQPIVQQVAQPIVQQEAHQEVIQPVVQQEEVARVVTQAPIFNPQPVAQVVQPVAPTPVDTDVSEQSFSVSGWGTPTNNSPVSFKNNLNAKFGGQ